MPIVCGTDLSAPASHAVTAAASLAARMNTTLHLVHAIELGPESAVDEAREVLHAWAQRKLREEVDRLSGVAPAVEIHVAAGTPDEVLRDVVKRTSSTLAIVAGSGRDGRHGLGSRVERLAQGLETPLVVVRQHGPFEAWLRASVPLRILLCADDSPSCDAAMRWIGDLSAFGPCEVVVAHLYWPPVQFERLGLSGVRSYLEPATEVTRTLEREFSERLTLLTGLHAVRFRLEPHLGRLDDRLIDLAREEVADLVVVGSHARGPLTRLWEGSVARGVLRGAATSVACIPLPAEQQPGAIPFLRSVLIATDFSPIGTAAIPLGYSIVAPGGTVHLVHIVDAAQDPIQPRDLFDPPAPDRAELHESLARRLQSCVPVDAASRGRTTRVHVLEAGNPGKAINQAAERLGVDALCLGTRGRGKVGRALLGSVAHEVLDQSTRPVLLAPKAVE